VYLKETHRKAKAFGLHKGTSISIQEEKDTLNLISYKDSPFFVKYYRSFKDSYYIYFMTEYIEGRDLFDVIRTIGILSI